MTSEHLPRPLGRIVEEQCHRWDLVHHDAEDTGPRRPVVTLSRQHGAGGAELAGRLARVVGLDLFDRELVHQIAESAHLRDSVVQALDDRDRQVLEDWLVSLVSDSYLSPASYRFHLTRVLGAIARHGGAVVLGRGAHLVLGPHEAVRVLVVAPIEDRVRTVARRDGIDATEARHRIDQVEAARREFLQRHFRTDFADPTCFDLVLNTGALGMEGAFDVLRSALQVHHWPARTPALALS
ncbi:MAG: cytidylate kinase-like family protein [Vicinamibacteria bacterium]|nr:cytidylate kinase-like family protein [Vicinamibacteria bacterium]